MRSVMKRAWSRILLRDIAIVLRLTKVSNRLRKIVFFIVVSF